VRKIRYSIVAAIQVRRNRRISYGPLCGNDSFLFLAGQSSFFEIFRKHKALIPADPHKIGESGLVFVSKPMTDEPKTP